MALSNEEEEKLTNLLVKAGLVNLVPAFLKEKVTVEIIPLLQQSDLEKLGVQHVGERVILLNLAKGHERDKKVGTEMKKLFGFKQENPMPSTSTGRPSTSSGCDSLLGRADGLCKHLRAKKSLHPRRRGISNSHSIKEVQKGLVLIDYQGKDFSDVQLRDYEKVYDGSIRYHSGMCEESMRNEIVRLIRQKESKTHELKFIVPTDFDFVKCANRCVKEIDGDTPFDASGVSQVYKNGAVYVRLNSCMLLSSDSKIQDHDSDDTDNELLPPAKIVRKSPVAEELQKTETLPLSHVASNVTIDVDAIDSDSDLQTAISLSKESAAKEALARDGQDFVTIPCTLADVVKRLQRVIRADDPFDMVVRRAHVLQDAMRRSFDPTKKLIVQFLGEEGSDGGGLSREFFRLVTCHSSRYLELTGCFKHNSLALQDGVYFKLGQLMAMALVQGGGAVRILSPSVFNYLSGMKPSDIIVEINEVPEADVRCILEKISSATTSDELKSVVVDNLALLMESGITKPFTQISIHDKVTIVQSIALHHVILRTLGELSQFRDGLMTLGVHKAMAEHGEFLQEFYVNRKSKVTADSIRKLFKSVKFSENGSNARQKEEGACMNFLNYLDECEKAKSEIDIREMKEFEEDEGMPLSHDSHPCTVTLGMVMSFFSGADDIPPLGYIEEPTMHFNTESLYPTASTCALQLTLPTRYTDYVSFKHALDTAFTMHGGFGMT